MKKQILIETITFLFIILFVYAAVNKLNDAEKFRVQLGQSPLLMAFAEWLVWIVPAVELIISVMLAISRFRLFGFYASFCLMVVFTAYIAILLNFADYVPCSCGGILEKLGWGEHLIFNIGFTLLAALAIVILFKEETRQKETISLLQ